MAQHTSRRPEDGARYGRSNRPPDPGDGSSQEQTPGGRAASFAANEAGSSSECPECGGTLRSIDNELTCEECGLLAADQRIDPGPEWRAMDEGDSETKSRVGSPMSAAIHDGGLSTQFPTTVDGRGNTISGRRRQKFKRLKKWHRRASTGDKVDRNRISAFTHIRRITDAMGLAKNARDRSCELFREAHEEGLLIGDSLEAYAAAAVYAACRVMEFPRTLEDVLAHSSADKQDIRRTYRKMNRELGLKALPPKPKKFIPRILSDVDAVIEGEARKEMLALADEAWDKNIATARKPGAVAAGIVYYVDESGMTQSEIADVAGATAYSLRQSYQEIEAMVEEEDLATADEPVVETSTDIPEMGELEIAARPSTISAVPTSRADGGSSPGRRTNPRPVPGRSARSSRGNHSITSATEGRTSRVRRPGRARGVPPPPSLAGRGAGCLIQSLRTVPGWLVIHPVRPPPPESATSDHLSHRSSFRVTGH